MRETPLMNIADNVEDGQLPTAKTDGKHDFVFADVRNFKG